MRVIAASNRNLAELVEHGEFRKDLFFRLNVVPLHIPPLRERREDIAPLVKMLLRRFADRYQTAVKELSPAAMRCLEEHAWPGNVRELENVLERSFLFSEGPVIQRISFDLAPRLGHVPLNETADLRQLKKNAADEVERRVLESLQEQTSGDVRAMAAALNLTQRAIYQKLSHHGLGTTREAKS